MLFLAEFIIHLSEKHSTPQSFKKVLQENGAEFSDSFVSNLLRIIQHMRPSKNSATTSDKGHSQVDTLAEKFPGLALPNEPQIPLVFDETEEEMKDIKKDDILTNDGDVVADLMAQFEADAPSRDTKESKRKEKSRSPEKNTKQRDRSRHQEHRSDRGRSGDRERRPERNRSRNRHRDRSQERHRDRSQDRQRNRSRDRHRERSRSRHRNRSNERHRNRSRERRNSRERNRSRDRNRDNSAERHVKKESSELDEDPVPGKVSLLYIYIERFEQIKHT